MENITDITSAFGKLFIPKKALVFYSSGASYMAEHYIETIDIGEDGFPCNARPLTIKESCTLAKQLNTSNDLRQSFLRPNGLLPENLLYINPDAEGYAIWWTPQRKVRLFFHKDLEIPCGKANIPPLVWKAYKDELVIYALGDSEGINEDTPLFHAPFFNIYDNGTVCMGNVDVEIEADASLEDFIAEWQRYFFNSYFSHLLCKHSSRSNIVQLWQGLIRSNKKFPIAALNKNGLTLKDIING